MSALVQIMIWTNVCMTCTCLRRDTPMLQKYTIQTILTKAQMLRIELIKAIVDLISFDTCFYIAWTRHWQQITPWYVKIQFIIHTKKNSRLVNAIQRTGVMVLKHILPYCMDSERHGQNYAKHGTIKTYLKKMVESRSAKAVWCCTTICDPIYDWIFELFEI